MYSRNTSLLVKIDIYSGRPIFNNSIFLSNKLQYSALLEKSNVSLTWNSAIKDKEDEGVARTRFDLESYSGTHYRLPCQFDLVNSRRILISHQRRPDFTGNPNKHKVESIFRLKKTHAEIKDKCKKQTNTKMP